jgi:hypothetical protein
MAVTVQWAITSSGRFSPHYDVAADGRFLAITRPKDEVVERAAIAVVLNWQAGLKK